MRAYGTSSHILLSVYIHHISALLLRWFLSCLCIVQVQPQHDNHAASYSSNMSLILYHTTPGESYMGFTLHHKMPTSVSYITMSLMLRQHEQQQRQHKHGGRCMVFSALLPLMTESCMLLVWHQRLLPQ